VTIDVVARQSRPPKADMPHQLLNSLNPWVRSQQTVSRLLDQLASADPACSKSAETALEAIFYPGRPAAGPSIWTWAQYSNFVERHLRRIRASPVVLPLLDAVAGQNHAARLFAIRALAANQEPRAFDGIVAALQDPSGEIRAAAARSLFHYRDRRSVKPLIHVLSDEEEVPRQFAANTLGFIADPLATGPLVRLLDSQIWGDRRSALYALADICDEASLPAIRRHLRDPARRVRKGAKAALANYDRRRRQALAASRKNR
jgi:HEAT repeat protein